MSCFRGGPELLRMKKRSFIRVVLHYIKDVIFFRREIGLLTKRNFSNFGKQSILAKPYLQLSGCKNIVIGMNTTILSYCRLSVYGDSINDSIIIGNNCYIGYNFTVLASSKSKIIIGNNVLIASSVIITNENHGIDPTNKINYMDQELTSNDVYIGDGCWIGEKVCILPGVQIGKKCIIGAGAVVTKSIPEYSIAVGNPAKITKIYNFKTKRWERLAHKK